MTVHGTTYRNEQTSGTSRRVLVDFEAAVLSVDRPAVSVKGA